MTRPPGEPRRVAYLYLLPGLALFGAFVLYPLARAGWISLFEWDGVTRGTWVGADNYAALAEDADLRRAFLHSAVLLVFYAALPVAIGLVLAGAASRTRVRGLAAVRTILFLPQVIALVVVAVTWRLIYQPTGWLGDFDLALPAVGLIGTWVAYGLCFVLFMAGVQKVPRLALRRGAGRRRRSAARVLRGHAAGAQGRDRGRAHAVHDRGPAQLRHRVPHDLGRARGRHLGSRARGVRAGVRDRRGRARGGDRRLPGGDHLRALVRDQPDGRPGGAHVIDRREQVLAHVVLGVFALIALAPVVKIVLGAGSFATAWDDGHFSTYLRSSAIVTASVVLVSSVLSILAGYAFGLMRFRGEQVLFYVILLGLTIPMEAIVVPLYYDLRDVGLTDTYWALILPQAALSTAFGTFWMRAFFRSVPRSLIEAARLDGSSSWMTLWRVVLPLGRPAVLTMVVLVFMWTWNEFLLALVMVSDESLRTAPLGLAFFQGRNTSDEGPAHGGLADRRRAGRARRTCSCSGTSSAACSAGR